MGGRGGARTWDPDLHRNQAVRVKSPKNQPDANSSPRTAIAALFRVMNRYVGNLPPMAGVFPDYPAPVIRNAGADREMVLMRWGMPPPLRTGGPPVTNIRNTSSPHWRGWLKPESRCLVPLNSFAEYAPEPNPETKKDVIWFALNDDRPLAAFAGRWTRVQGRPGTKAMPLILTTPEEVETWMTAPPEEALKLQRPLQDGMLRIVARGIKEDPAGSAI